jgi:hypothetical protein
MASWLFLVPGYLGYRGKEGYWGFWDGVLPLLRAQGFRCVPVSTEPIGAIERRAERLRDAILAETQHGDALTPDDRIVLFGFSTGGLDARYLLSPGTPLELPDAVRKRVRTLVTLATPHRGTPLADFYRAWRADDLVGFFAGLFAKWTTSERLEDLGRLAHKHRATLERVLPEPQRDQFLRFVEGLLVATPEEREGIQGFLESLSRSRGSLEQLRVGKMPAFNETVPDADDVRYFSYVTGAEPLKPTNFGSALYALGAFINSRFAGRDLPESWTVSPDKVCTLDGRPLESSEPSVVVTRRLSDAVVPTGSQFWGEFRGYAPIDHHAAYGRPLDLMRVPEFAGRGLSALYERIGSDLMAD